MSTRCRIVYSWPIYIYEESNDDFKICIQDLEGKRNEYNGDVELDLQALKDIVEQLNKYLKDK